MKKLILLLLVVLGGVTQGQAKEYTVYFKPSSNWTDANAKFKLNMKKAEGDVWKAVEFSETSISGIYSAKYDTEYDALIQILRFNSDYSEQWNYSAQMTNVPKGDIFLYNDDSNNNCALKFYCVAASSTDITNGSNTWSGSDVATALIPASDYSTSNNVVLTLTNKLLTAGLTYQFKIVTGEHWYPGANVEFKVAKDGYYTINYTFNTSNNIVVSHSEELTKEVEFKYSVQQYINDSYTQLGEMTMTTDGNAVLTVSQDLTSGTDVLYKVKRAVYADGVNQNNDKWSWYNDGTNGHYTFKPAFSKTYTLTFFYSPVYQSSWVSGLAPAVNYYFVGGNGAWSVNQEAPLSESDGVYSITVSNKAGHTFAIIPDYAFTNPTTVSNWEYVIHPQAQGEENVSVDFANINGLINVANSNNNWEVGSTYADYITFTLDPSTNTWSIAPYFEKKLVAEAEGYATFSSKYDVAVPEGLKASYASAVTAGGGAITWTEFESGVPAGQGALLEGAVGTYKFTPATEAVAPSTNYLKANLTQQKLEQTSTIGGTTYTHYVLYKDSERAIGFYKVNSNGSWIAAGSAYLEVPNAANEAPAFFAIGGGEGTTDIRAINNGQLIMDNVYYDLSGRRVANPTKGLYIVNGKKVIVK